MKIFMRILSMVLIICMLCNMLPVQIIATGNTATAEQQTLTAGNPETESITTEIIGEVTEKRTEYSKEFLLSDGSMIAAVYADPIHYEKDGSWQEIDNTLKTTTDGKFVNTAGAWAVALPQSISKTAPVTVSRDGHQLSFFMSGELCTQGNLEVAAVGQTTETATVTVDGKAQTFQVSSAQTVAGQMQTIDTAAAKAAAQHPELILDKNASALMYSGVYANTQLRYDLHGSTLKESVILQSYSSNLRGYRYTLNTGDLLPLLNEDGSIYFLSGKKDVVFVMKAPYLIDDAEQCSNDVSVSLTGSDGTYTLTYLLPTAWLASADRAWPVVLDPAVTTSPSVTNTRDHTVASNGSYHYERPVLECGYGNVNHVQRIFLKYRVLPKLSAADVIVDAQVALYKIENSDSIVTVDVHKVLSTWESETLTWTNKPSFDSTIEDYALINLKGYYTWNVTDIVRGWYSGANTGMMFKASDQYEDGSSATWKQFASSDNGNSAWMPSLQITYRNNNGIEDYWDYTASSAGRAGTGYVNSFTGNLAWIRSDMGFGGNRMPVSISHIYNLNDAVAQNTNDNTNPFGMGHGWRTNFNQRVYVWEDDTDYYIWEDSDGTSHYFYNESYGVFKDEDGLELTLRSVNVASNTNVTGGQYSITDKGGNVSVFDANGRLIRMQNNQETKSYITVAYTSDGKIDYVTDGVGRQYDFSYTNGLLTEIKYLGSGTMEVQPTTSFGYDDYDNLTSITDTDTKNCFYFYNADETAETADDHVLNTAQDIDGYELKYIYNAPAAYQPYRVLGIAEYDGSVEGGSLTIQYDHNQTTFTSYLDETENEEKSIKQILQFNNWGNVTCIQDEEGHAQYAQYAKDSNSSAKGNQLVKSSKLQNTVSNLLDDPSFEHGTLWTANNSSITVARVTDTAYMGNYSTKVTHANTTTGQGAYSESITVPAGETVTFSAYVKTGNTPAKFALHYKDNRTGTTKNISYCAPQISANQDWTRTEVSFYNYTGITLNICAFLFVEDIGDAYIDCVQVEFANTASRYNLVEDSDFRDADRWSSLSGITTAEEAAAPILDANVYELTGNPRAKNRLSQTVPVSGEEGDAFVLTGWAKGNSAYIYEEEELPSGQDKRVYALYGTFNYSDNTTSDEFIAHFNPDTDQWQYAAQVMVAEKAYSSVKVELVYDYNVNTVCFDGIQLYKEEFGNSYTYDENGNITSVVDLQKQETKYKYDNNNLTEETLPTGAKLTYTYDNYHNMEKATSATGVAYEFDYDAWGNNTSVSIVQDENTKITSTARYSTDGNLLLEAVDTLGNKTTYNYNANTGALESVRYPEDTEDTQTEYSYDNMYRVASAVAATDSDLNLSASYTYTDDLLTAIQTPSTRYNFTYGDFALRTKVQVGNRTLAEYSYADVTNYLTELDYGNNDSVKYIYDDQGRTLKQIYGTGRGNEFATERTIAYAYNNNGNLATVEDWKTGFKTTYYYDLTDRIMKYVESGTNYSHSVGYEYDNINNLTSQVETINGVDRSSSYTYDQDNRVTSKQTGNTKVTYTYDGFSRISTQTTYNGEDVVLTETFTYNPGSSQIATYTTTAGTSVKTYSYTYDKNGNILSICTSQGDITHTTSYEYDSANQLVRENNQEKGYTHTWTYDNAGNILERKEYAYTTGNLETATVTAAVSYVYETGDNKWGDLLTHYGSQEFYYDEIGNITDDGTWTYDWQHGRQLVRMAKQDNSVTWDYTYNPDGMRLSRSNGTTTYNYVYNGSQLTAMTVGENTLYFSYDADGTPMSVNFNGTEYFYTSNIQGDVTGIVNSNGVTVVTYAYDAWGNILSVAGSNAATLGTLNPLRYRGYIYDQEANLYYLQSRYYNPELGRFISADSLVSTGQGLLASNMFAYCNNNPVNAIDSNGRSALAIGLFIGGSAIIGGLAGAFTAACTGGNIWEGAAEGAALGATAATATVLAPVLLPATASGLAVGATAFALSSLGGIIIDYTTQRVSHRITTGSDDGFILDVGRLLKTGFTTGISGVLPTYGKPQESVVNAVGSLIIGGDATLINSAIEIIITKFLEKLGGK